MLWAKWQGILMQAVMFEAKGEKEIVVYGPPPLAAKNVAVQNSEQVLKHITDEINNGSAVIDLDYLSQHL